MSAWTCRQSDRKAAAQIVPPRSRIPYWKGLGADSEEKREPVSDIDTAVVDSLKVLDPNRLIREADIDRRERRIARSRLTRSGQLVQVADPARNFFSPQTLRRITTPERLLMRTVLFGLLAIAGIAIATPVVSPASAQIKVETPVGDVKVGHEHDRDHRRCHTVTIRRHGGSVRRVRRCN
jgi:hypothetical protein